MRAYEYALVMYKPTTECVEIAKTASSILKLHGIEVEVLSADDVVPSLKYTAREFHKALVVVVGGDGTFFKAAHLFAKSKDHIIYPYPCGRRNFYYEKPVESVEKVLEAIISGNYATELIPLYELRYGDNAFLFVNDAVLVSSNLGKVGTYTVSISSPLCKSKYSFEGDGIIISTSYGSSGHNLSAKGPLVIPEIEVLVITHLNPMQLGLPSIVVPSSARISIEVQSVSHVYADGTYLKTVGKGDIVEVLRSSSYVKVARIGSYRNFIELVMKSRRVI